MEASEGEEDEIEWLFPGPCDGPRRDSPAAVEKVSCKDRAVHHAQAVSIRNAWNKIIVHLDLDCFYAQVEMICNPELRSKPLGVQQKYIVVTCNYEARNVGVKKLMSVKEAKEKCPELVLVNGEDLTKYREFSYRVTELLNTFTPLVERLGFDENFVDITELVEKRLKQWGKVATPRISVCGHVYNDQTVDFRDPVHVRLTVGSQIAAEMREAMCSRLGLTGCAGVASNKLLSKLVSGTFKPNQQTMLLPESRPDLMASLDHIRKIPGIGFKTAERLMKLGLHTVQELQACSSAILEKELGNPSAHLIQKLSQGEDHSPVTPSGAPQSISDEDSFKKCSSEPEVKKKMEELLINLLDRLHKDGRKPHTIRLTIRQFSSTNRWFNRESRQCPIPPHLVQKIGTGDTGVKTHLISILMKLFRKMIKAEVSFHLTLLNICFSNLKAPPASSKESIGFYLSHSSSSSGNKIICNIKGRDPYYTSVEHPVEFCNNVLPGENNARCMNTQMQTSHLLKESRGAEFPSHLLPTGVDDSVFSQLPRVIKEEIISSQKKERDSTMTVLSQGVSALRKELSNPAQPKVSSAFLHSGDVCQNASALMWGDAAPVDNEYPVECQKPHGKDSSQNDWRVSSKVVLPPSVDPITFSELPTEAQEELLAEWKSQEPASKMLVGKAHTLKKTKRGLASPPGSNSLLHYFKPR